MVPLLFRGLKGVNISCASPSSTSIYSNKDNGSKSSPTQILKDINKGRPVVTKPFFPFKSNSQRNRNRRKSSASENDVRPPSIFLSPTNSSRFLLGDDDNYASSFEFYPDFENDPTPDLIKIDPSRFHFGEGDGSLDLRSSASFCRPEKLVVESYFRSNSSISKTVGSNNNWENFDDGGHDQRSETINLGKNQKQFGFRASTSSWSPEKGEIKNSQEVLMKKSVVGGGKEEQIDLRVSSSSSSSRFRPARRDETPVLNSSFSSRTKDQVVVLKVSLHCKGCEGKVRKHLSRMQGVTSFSIDFPTKKVTVVGDVTPLAVLSSVSKVKHAQLWPSPPAPPPPPLPPSSTSRSH